MRTAKTDQTWQMPRLICLCWVHRLFCWFCHAQAHLKRRFDMQSVSLQGSGDYGTSTFGRITIWEV